MIIPVKVKKRILTCKKPLVSDNVETYSISITVDEEWEGFNTRVIFYNDSIPVGDSNPKNVLIQNLTDITIPWEVLQEPGNLYLTLIGVKDSEVMITQEMSDPIIVNKAGMSEGETPLEPTPDTIQVLIQTAQQSVKIAQSVRDDADSGKFNGAPGEDGAPGKDGKAATIAVGSVTTGEAGSAASVINSGTESAAVLDFVIPQGEQGLKGDKGDNGSDYVLTTTDKAEIAKQAAPLVDISARTGRKTLDLSDNTRYSRAYDLATLPIGAYDIVLQNYEDTGFLGYKRAGQTAFSLHNTVQLSNGCIVVWVPDQYIVVTGDFAGCYYCNAEEWRYGRSPGDYVLRGELEQRKNISSTVTAPEIAAVNHTYTNFSKVLTKITITSVLTDVGAEFAFAFESGETATVLVYPAENIKWVGDNCADGVFIPTANASYEVNIKQLGPRSNGTKPMIARVSAF